MYPSYIMTSKQVLMRIKAEMLYKDITQKELAERIKLGLSTLRRRFEHPSDFKLIELLSIFNVLEIKFDIK